MMLSVCIINSNVPFIGISHAKGNDIQSGQVVPSLFTMHPSSNIIIDTIKLAEDDHGKGKQVILRLYEAYGGKSTATLNR